ncbi:phosphoglycolate phosphatase [Pontibacter ummariensis]|uniref:phosphoglycolate phosphatase n=1 Tax=Pontibacter ummariensis TaxID=1610492 RepID=A0A239LAH7_9BACT|nr:HAD family hydrolase [Pontibacter ummariensis]PRY03995.1 phosphoglycolate phosphatase [Pontibacter ummariensis]SNT26659.1 phosphoglycolate phosphatase [Pontibacter ummariensis]
MNNTTTDGLIFDLDGTLWDSTQTVADAWQAAIEDLPYVDRTVTKEDVAGIAGMPYDAIYEKLFPKLNKEQRQELMERCAKEELEYLHKKGGQLYEGLEETLTYLQNKGYKLFIVSNCQRGYIEGFLEFHGLQRYFDDHLCFGDDHKPKGKNIRAIIERNGLKQAVYIGDTKGDYDASQVGEVPFVFARYGFGTVEAEVKTIDQLADLKKFF